MSDPKLKDPKEVAEKDLAKMLHEKIEKLGASIPQLVADIKACKAHVEGYKDVDIKSVLTEVESLKATSQMLAKAIANNKHSGLYIPGLAEDAQKNTFSIIRSMRAIKEYGKRAGKDEFEKAGAGYEWEVFEAARAKASTTGQVVGIDEQGGFFVPDQVIPEVIAAIYRRSVLIDLAGDGMTRVSVIDGLVGGTVKLPKFRGGVVAHWVGEKDPFVESFATVGRVTMQPKKLGVLVRLTDEMLRFGSFGFEGLLRNDMNKAVAEKVDSTILYGKGTDNEPRGIFRMPVDDGTLEREGNGIILFSAETGAPVTDPDGKTWTSTEADFDVLDEMKGALEDRNIGADDDSFAFVSAPKYWRKLRQLKVSNFATQTTDRPYLLGAPMLRDETLRGIIGDFDRSTMVPVTNKAGESIARGTLGGDSTSGDVVGANWNEVLFGRWSGLEIVTDDGKGTGFASDETLMKMRLYCDVGHRQELGIVATPDVDMS